MKAMAEGSYNVEGYTVDAGTGKLSNVRRHQPDNGLFKESNFGVALKEQPDGSVLLSSKRKSPVIVKYGAWHYRKAIKTEAHLTVEQPKVKIYPHKDDVEFFYSSHDGKKVRKVNLRPSG